MNLKLEYFRYTIKKQSFFPETWKSEKLQKKGPAESKMSTY